MRKKARTKAERQEETPVILGYDYSTPEARVETASRLLAATKSWRKPFEADWKLWDDYYNFLHDVSMEYRDYCQERDIPWLPATVPDPYIQVESQIVPTVPEPEFRGRDEDQDGKKAKVRELAVKYVCEANRLEDKNTSNERRLVKLGDAWWKAYWDKDMRAGASEGDIHVEDVALEDIYPDPTVGAGDFQQGQYLAHVYRMHKVDVARKYGMRLRELGVDLEQLVGTDYQDFAFLRDMDSLDLDEDMVEILEFWYRNPVEYENTELGMTVPAGAVCCTIQAANWELEHVPMYWKTLSRQCSLFPFVHYWRIRDENHFYNKSELFAIKDLVDAADRKLGSMLLNDAMMSNDIIVAEEGAFADGCEPVNEPGAMWLMKPNKAGAATRLGGLHSGSDNTLVNYLSEQMQRASRNYDSNMGRETSRQTTATGLAMLRDDAGSQADIKKADRLKGFERLYELIDWLCLEFYSDQRLLYIGAKDAYSEPQVASWDRTLLSSHMGEIRDTVTQEVVREGWDYWPKVDVSVNAGDGVIRGKQATLSALDKLLAIQVTESNYFLLTAMVDILDIPQKQEIKEQWQEMFQPTVPKEVTQALAADPQLLQLVETLVSAQNQTGDQGTMGQVQMGGDGGAMPGM